MNELTAPGTSQEVALAIADVTAAAKDVIEGAFPPLWVKGEVSNFTAHRNGHWYFSLRDKTAQLACVVCRAMCAVSLRRLMKACKWSPAVSYRYSRHAGRCSS